MLIVIQLQLKRPVYLISTMKKKALLNESLEQDIAERRLYAQKAYDITQSWVGFLIVLTISQISLAPLGMKLSDATFIVVFTTTTASIFGFWILVGRYLFNTVRSK